MNKTCKIDTFLFCPVETLTSLVLLFINFFHPNLKLQKLHYPLLFIILQAPNE